MQDQPARSTWSANDFDGVVSQLLDEFAAADFRSAERVLDTMRRQGRTISGYPRIRPSDCDRVIRAIRAAFEANRPLFVTGDRTIIERFDNFLDAFARTDVRLYPRELMQARILQAEAKLLLHDPEGARELIGEYADRPYKIEGDRDDISRLMRLDCQARAAAGAVDGLGRLSVDRALALSRIWPYNVRSIASDFIDFMSLGRDAPARAGLLTWLLCQSARKTARARIGGGSFFRQIMRRPVAGLGLWLAAASLFLLRFGDLRLASPAGKLPKREIVVSRAMGGIGDLFVMTPGLRALSRRYSTKVKLVIDRKYFDIFRNNPYVEPVDIDGPPVDVARARVWYNLTLCPAGQYEAARRPFVKKGPRATLRQGHGRRHARALPARLERRICSRRPDDRLPRRFPSRCGSRRASDCRRAAVRPRFLQGSPKYRTLHRSAQRRLRHHHLSSSSRRIWRRVAASPRPPVCRWRSRSRLLRLSRRWFASTRLSCMRRPLSTCPSLRCSVRPTANYSPATIATPP